MSQFFKFLSVLGLIGLLTGCGQMGPLYLPKDNQKSNHEKTASTVQSNSVSEGADTDKSSQSKE